MNNLKGHDDMYTFQGKKKNKKQNTSVQNSIWHLEGSQELLAECFLNEVSHRAQSLGQHPLHGC